MHGTVCSKKGSVFLHRYVCSVCGGNCDAGELINGICHECRATMDEKSKVNGGLIHIVKEGDCLYSIYREYKPKADFSIWYSAVIGANRLNRVEPLKEGEQLLIPEGFY